MNEKDNNVTSQTVYRARRRFVTLAASIGGLAWLASHYGLEHKRRQGQPAPKPKQAQAQAEPPVVRQDAPVDTPIDTAVETPSLASRLATHRKSSRYTESERDTLTPLSIATTYNNFYEFGTDKSDPSRYAHRMTLEPWTVKIDGLCHKGGIFDIDKLVAPEDFVERVYRLRCVEAWSMVIPWIGFELNKLIKRVEPMAAAKYVAFQTLYRPEEMPQQRSLFSVIDYPYVEGLRLDEAMHPLTLVTLGMYGDRLYPQNGAPIKIVVPWKYGFKSPKSIVRITFTETQPPTTWNLQSAREYGFYSNVNPTRSHPRWSQTSERRFISDSSIFNTKRIETLPFNGYGEEVAQLYTGMDLINRYY